MTSLIETLLDDIGEDTELSDDRRALLRDLLARVVAVAESDVDTKNLRVAARAVNELLEAFNLFEKWSDRSKLTIFGSARTKIDSPLYEMTRELAQAMAEREWIIISGAGPGIMEASARGAGMANTLGVNIQLPFEQNANAYIDTVDNLVTMKYFFTRKVALTRPANAFVVLPGGLGTMDELFEVLTLLDTGKTTPAPVILLDTPDGMFWKQWMTFINEGIVRNHYVATDDMFLVRLATSIAETVDEIEHFYSNYRDFAIEGARGLMSLHHAPTSEQLDGLRAKVPMFNEGVGYQVENEQTLSFDFDGRNYSNLRQVIDVVNDWTL
ncbi:MAG TPA: TIGR00730 family Rossman fold protein [Acidimicrobiales bacterium]|nr:TIGR00730 family Rossman fold protein [Acidimicrobiales bacterium]